jgi:hypothetical protein
MGFFTPAILLGLNPLQLAEEGLTTNFTKEQERELGL